MEHSLGAPRRTAMITDCPCDADHQVVIAERLADTPDCWNWGGTINKDGYGTVSHAGRRWLAHRLSYLAFVGPLPAGLVLDHLCCNTRCVRPDHLEATTDRVNILRGDNPAARNARKVACKYGHPLPSPPPEGRSARACATCARAMQSARMRSGLLTPGDGDPRHGTLNGYGNLGCRCTPCRAANAAAHRAYMARRRAARASVEAA